MTVDDFFKPMSTSKRVLGFANGYNNQFGPAQLFLGDKEYIEGWNEGVMLRLDELRAQVQQDKREKT
jgi:hypothetical protein